MSSLSVELVGQDALIRMLAKAGAAAPRTLARALHDEAQDIFARSQAIVPFDEGVLSGSESAQLHPPSIVGGEIVVEITYGGNASGYAAVQHENRSFRHDAGRRSHYLQTPFEDAQAGMANRLATRVEAILRGLV